MFRSLVWKDVKLFLVDRQAVVMSFVIPVLIASILGWLDLQAATGATAPIPVAVVDNDSSDATKAILDRLRRNPHLRLTTATGPDATSGVQNGATVAALELPEGFGTRAVAAMTGGKKPEASFLVDPSKPLESQTAMGYVLQDTSAAVASAAFGSFAGDGSAPFALREVDVAAHNATWSRAAHDYAGFGIQGLLFFAIEAAVGLLRERRQGIWKRLRASPVPPGLFVVARAASSTLLAFGIVLAIFAIGAGLFGIRILGSLPGFLAIAVAVAFMAATFGLMMATLARSEAQGRAFGFLVILVMLASGGAWFPIERMPDWVQGAATFMPVRWAVEGLDAMTWRGQPFSAAAKPAGLLLLFACVFLVVSLINFRALRDQP